jgi:hypothetical protein
MISIFDEERNEEAEKGMKELVIIVQISIRLLLGTAKLSPVRGAMKR